MKRVLGCMFSVLSVMLLLLAWMVFTPSGLQRVLGVLPGVTVNGVQGSLADGFDINTLQWTQPESASTAARHVQLQNLRVVPEWQALRHGTLRMQVLSAKQVDIVWPSTPNSPPLVLPNRMDLPLDVELKQVLVEALAVNGQTVQNVQLQAQVKGPRLEVQHLETTVQGMALKAKVHLGLVQPYVLDAGLHGVRQDEWLNIDGQLSVTGSLTQMQLAFDARLTPNPTKAKQQVVEQTVHVETHLRPFDPHPFEQVRLQASRLNPKDWWSEAPRAQLDIRANVTATEDFSRLDGQVAVHNTNPSSVREGGLPVNQAQMELALFQKNHELEALQILHLTLKDQTASLEGHGFLKLTKDLPLEAEVFFDGLNPKRYWPPSPSSGLKPLDGELNGKLRVSGALKQRSGAIDLAFEHSHLANTPFVFEAKMQGNPKRLQNVWVKGDVLGNQLQVSGAYGEVGDALSVRLNWPKLPELGALLQQPLSGVLTAEAELRTQPWGVSGQAQTKVRQLRWGQSLAVGQLDANVQLGDQAQAPWEGELSAQGVGLPSPTEPAWVESLQVKLKGTQKQHTVQVEASSKQYLFSRRRALSASASLEGGMQCPQSASLAWCWQGRLNTLQLQGLWALMRSLSLVQPAPLKLSPQGVELGLVDLKGEDNTRLQNTLFRLTDSQVRIEGKALALPVPRLSRLLNTDVSVEPNELVLGADWRYQSSADGVSGQVNIAHVSGGLQVLEDLQLDVPLQDLKAQVNFTRQAAQMDLMVNAKDFGLVSANLKLPIAQNPNTKAWGLAEHLPMEGAVGASFSKLNWLGPMLNGSLRTQGSGQVAVAIGGTLKVPDVQGRLFGMGLEVFHLDQGVRLEEGQVVVDFNTDQARIQTLDFTIRQRLVPRLHQEELMPLVKGSGKLTAQGVWNLSGLNGRLSVNLDRALVVQRPDRWVLASSTIQVEQPQQQGQAVNVRGDVTLHGAYIETPENSAATLDDDVVIKGRTNTTTAALPVDVQLQTHLGPLFFLNAEGLKTRLEGGLRLVLQEGGGRNNGLNGPRKAGRRLLATGTIRTEDGTYRAYGQELTIEHGVVNFQGPIDNPGLNVRAVRKGGAVEAGVLVTGSAQRPKVSLVSDPAVSDAEKLSWMLIGRGTNASDREQLLLLTAAQALFGNKEDSPTRKIAKRLGIDEFGLSTGSLTAADSRSVGSKVAQAPGADLLANSTGADDPLLSQRIITLGKKLSDKLFVSFDQSVTTAASVLKLNYQHSRPLSVILRTGADNAIDVLYQISFD